MQALLIVHCSHFDWNVTGSFVTLFTLYHFKSHIVALQRRFGVLQLLKKHPAKR